MLAWDFMLWIPILSFTLQWASISLIACSAPKNLKIVVVFDEKEQRNKGNVVFSIVIIAYVYRASYIS